MRVFYLFVFIIFSCVSCSHKIHLQEAYLKENKALDKENFENRVDIRTYYGGDGLDYITFQIDIDNRSSDTIQISEQDIELNVGRKRSRRVVYNPIRKRNLVRDLELAEERLDREKKYNTVANVIMSGAGILGGVLGGASGAETIIWSSESTADILAQREGYNVWQASIEEQIAYINEYTLESAVIPPGRSVSYDVHFDRLMIDAYCEMKVFCEDEVYRYDYELVVEEIKVRR